MVLKFKNAAAATTIAALALFATPVYAIFGVGDIVIDPSNLVQNTSSALAAVRNEMNTYNILIQQVKSAISLAKATASLKDVKSLAGAQEQLALYTRLRNIDSQLTNTIGRSLVLSQNLKAEYGSSQSSWKAYLASKEANEIARSESVASQYETLTQSMQDTAQRRQAILVELQDAQGQTGATQAVGAALDVVIGQNQQMITLMAQKSQQEAAAIPVAIKEKQEALRPFEEYQKRMREAAAKY